MFCRPCPRFVLFKGERGAFIYNKKAAALKPAPKFSNFKVDEVVKTMRFASSNKQA